jgi:glycosyltransferase involved in cell wall biosynthesis
MTAAYPTADARTSGIFVREHARAAASHADVAIVHLHRTDGVRRLRRVVGVDDEFASWRVDYPRRPLPVSYAANIAAGIAGFNGAKRAWSRPDLIHAHFFLAAAPAALLGFLHRIPVVTTEHWSVFLPSDPMQLSPLSRRVAKTAFERSSIVLPVSAALRDGIRASGIEPRFRVVPNAVDTTVFHPTDRRPAGHGGPWRLLTVSGLYEAKGYEFLLAALAKLVEREVAAHLDVVGDGDRRRDYEQLAIDLGVAPMVTFHGEKTKAEVAGFMRDADLFVLASRYENNPCAVLEAQVSGLPVVATRVGGVPEIVSSESGLLAEPCDADDLADRLQAALERLGDYDREAIARNAADRYGLGPIGDALAEVYAEALGSRSAR